MRNELKLSWALWGVAAIAGAGTANAESGCDGAMMTLHFQLLPRSGAVEMTTKATGAEEVAAIRRCGDKVVMQMAAGDFSFLKAAGPVPTLDRLRPAPNELTVERTEMPDGLKIFITSANPPLQNAIRGFLRCEIVADHTQDPMSEPAQPTPRKPGDNLGFDAPPSDEVKQKPTSTPLR